MALQQICSFFKTYKKILFFVGFFIGVYLILGDFAFAEGETPNPVISSEVSHKIIRALNGIITGAAAILGLVTSFITIFLYPGWVNGTMFGLEDYLKIIWIFVSNVVYFIFAFILIAIAFMNIIGKGEGTWELKQAMPKFIIGVLIVPFSWFFVQFLLSISSVLTVGVLTIPYESFSSETLFNKGLESLEKEKICKDVIINFSDENVGGTAIATGGEETLSERIVCKDGSMVTVREILQGTDGGAGLQNSVFGVINIYTYGILKVQELDTITGTDLESITKIADLIFKIVFDLLFVIVYMLLMVALLLALFVRGVRLWVYIMLSPAFGLLYFFGKGSEGFGDSGKNFNIKEFIALAMVPVYVSAALAFGLVFILVASEGIKDKTSSGDEDTLQAGGFSLTIKGAHGDGVSEKSPIAKLVVEIFGVVILWIAVMAALQSSNTTKAIVEPIAAFGKSVGELAAKAPTYAPIIPTGPGQKPMSVAGLGALGTRLEGHFRGEAQNRGSEFGQRIVGGDPNALMNRIERTLNTHATNETTRNDGTALREALRELGTTITAPGAERDRAITEINRRLGLDIDLERLTDPSAIARQIEEALTRAGNRITAPEMLNRGAITTFLNGVTPDPAAAPAAPTPTTLNITRNSTITPLVSGPRIAGADDRTRATNATAIANEIRNILTAAHTVERTEVEMRLTGIGITNTDDITAIITALGDKVV